MDKDRKKIQFTFEGSDYTLEYTPQSIRKMDRDGFNLAEIDNHIVNAPYDLFSGAFIARHNYVPVKERERMYEALVNQNEEGDNLLEFLGEMLKDELEFIINKPSGNVNWVAVR